MRKILVTGAAGFIGFHLCRALHHQGHSLVAFDNFNAYYNPRLKEARVRELNKEGIAVQRLDLCDRSALEELLQKEQPEVVIHLAAQAGVRHSLSHPEEYVKSNLEGFVSLLEAIRKSNCRKLIYASSSSVYGNQPVPFTLATPTDQPVNLYGATKKANEVIAYAYHHLFDLQCIGLRFFTVYGPWGRPDMAYFHFSESILDGQTICLFHEGKMERDFTYIDDIIDGILHTLECPEPYALFNLGGSKKTTVLHFLSLLEELLGKKARVELLPMQAGEMEATWSDISASEKQLQFYPKVELQEGLQRFTQWLLNFRSITDQRL